MIYQMGGVQIDPLQVVARSHDLVLHSRVIDYHPDQLDALLYSDRRFFDYGGAVFIYPMEELPYWRLPMRRHGCEGRYADFAAQHSELVGEVRAELRAHGPLGNRDFAGRSRVNSYRARKDTGLALYYLWLSGEVMTHSRRRFERLYDLRERIVPPSLDYEAEAEEAEAFFAWKASGSLGIWTAREWTRRFARLIQRRVEPAEGQRRLDAPVAAGELSTLRVEGRRELHYVPAADVSLLESLERGRVPDGWKPLGTTTEEEIIFLAPLEPVSARGQAKVFFDFDYIWEVYKPAAARRWGYYTLPVLYGDTLVARIDPKLDRSSRTLQIKGFWLEEERFADDERFTAALGRGLARFVRFHEAEQLDLSGIEPACLRQALEVAN